MGNPYRQEQIEGWVSDFLDTPRSRAHAGLIREYAPQVLATFLTAACDVRDVSPDEIEESDLKPALVEQVARLEMPGSVRPEIPGLCASFLEELESQGRLGGGTLLARYVRVLKTVFVGAAEGKGQTFVSPGARIGRNDPCPCGSGRKYKKCCLGQGPA